MRNQVPSGPRPKDGASHLGLVAAFPWEVASLLRRQRQVERLGDRRYRFLWKGQPVVLAIAGAGAENAYCAARALIQDFQLGGLVSVGFAGGLSEALKAGEVILADEVIEKDTGERFGCQAALLPIAAVLTGSLLSVSAVVNSAEEKRLLAARWAAVAVDMESGAVARASREAGLAFGAVKSITDRSSQSMAIDFQRCRSEHGGLSSWKIVREAMTSPAGLRDLWRLAGNSRRAAGNLALAFAST